MQILSLLFCKAQIIVFICALQNYYGMKTNNELKQDLKSVTRFEIERAVLGACLTSKYALETTLNVFKIECEEFLNDFHS